MSGEEGRKNKVSLSKALRADMVICKYSWPGLVLRSMSNSPSLENVNWNLSYSNVSHFSWGGECEVTGPHLSHLLPHPPMSKAVAMQPMPPTDQQWREAICFCQAGRIPACAGSNWIFVGREAERAPSCRHQTRRRLLLTSDLGVLHGPELPAVLWLETLLAWLRMLNVPSLQGEN